MVGFKTKNSTYYVDTQNKLIWGGKLGNKPKQYVEYSMFVGQPGYFRFNDNSCMQTGIIKQYI